MKRIAILFCILALLLAACSLPSAPEATQAPITTAPAQTAAPSELPTEPAQTEPVVTEPPVTEPTVTEPGYQAGGSPTAGGVVVWTDPSAYKPYSGPDAKYSRLHDGPLDHFEPSDDYGAVYPYAAARLFMSGNNGDSWEASARYGLVDASGRILTDGIYTSVKALSDYDYEFNEHVRLPFWVIQTIDNARVVEELYEGGSYSWIDGDFHCGLVSMDGSFMLPMEYRSISILGDGFLGTREWDGANFDVFNGSGRLLFTGADLLKGTDYPNVSVSDGGEGLYLIEFYGEDRDSQDWFCDAEGNRIFGPCAGADAFREGLACVTLDGENYGYIDKTGAWVIQPTFSSSGSFRDGKALIRTADSSTLVIDKTGRILFSAGPGVWLYRVDCGFRSDSSYTGTSFYDPDLNLLFEAYNVTCLDKDTFYEDLDDGIRLFRLDGTELSLSSVYNLSPGMTVLDGEAVEGYLGTCWDEDHLRYYFVPRDLSAVREIGADGALMTDYYYTQSYETVDECTNERWYLSRNGNGWNAVNQAGEIRTIPLRVNSLKLRGDRIMAVTDRACIYVDWEGNLLFSYPLDAQD